MAERTELSPSKSSKNGVQETPKRKERTVSSVSSSASSRPDLENDDDDGVWTVPFVIRGRRDEDYDPKASPTLAKKAADVLAKAAFDGFDGSAVRAEFKAACPKARGKERASWYRNRCFKTNGKWYLDRKTHKHDVRHTYFWVIRARCLMWVHADTPVMDFVDSKVRAITSYVFGSPQYVYREAARALLGAFGFYDAKWLTAFVGLMADGNRCLRLGIQHEAEEAMRDVILGLRIYIISECFAYKD